jgi:hypothetical protein
LVSGEDGVECVAASVPSVDFAPCLPHKQRVALSLQSLLFWQAVLEEPDPLLVARDRAAHDLSVAPLQTLRLASANVTTLRPRQEGDGGEGSARRIDLALQFAAAELQIIGIQESRSQFVNPRDCGDFWIVSSPASKAGAGALSSGSNPTLCPPAISARLRLLSRTRAA